MSIRFRINLMIALTVLVIVGFGVVFVVHNARREVLDEVRSSVTMALQLIGAGIVRQNVDEQKTIDWLSDLSRLDKTRHLKIQVERLPSQIIHFEPRDAAADEAAPSWFDWAVRPPPLVAEKRIDQAEGPALRILVEADPSDEIAEAWSEAQGFLFLILALAVTVGAVVHVTLGRAFRSIGTILEGLGEISHGGFERRLPHFGLPEFDRISDAFNLTAAALERARSENRELTQRSLVIEEEERRSLARELHDELGQSLSAIKVLAAALRTQTEADERTRTLQGITEVCDHLFAIVRGMMRRLRPTVLDDFGLAASLEDMIGNWRDRSPAVEIDFRCEDGVEEAAGSATIHLYRIVQEALTNIVKHAGATQVRVHLGLDGNAIRLAVADDGRGFEPGQTRLGLGLAGIRERAESLGGQFSLSTRPGRGVTLEVRIPCQNPIP